MQPFRFPSIICVVIILAMHLTIGRHAAHAQQLPSVQVLQDNIRSSFRGLSVPSDSIIWVSGSNGTVGRSTDAGNTWQWMIVPGFEKRDFRDIAAVDSLTAIIMAVDNPADILKTTDGGKNWKQVFHKAQEGMFLDAMHFEGESGICIGDPLKNETGSQSFYVLYTSNQGTTWNELQNVPLASDGEAIFAASGSNISHTYRHKWRRFAFITGGMQSRLHFVHWFQQPVFREIPIMKGAPSKGAFSMTSDGYNSFFIAGGDYNEYWRDSGNVVYTTNGGSTWKRAAAHGYRSCIIQVSKKVFITCGTNGVDISFNRCKSWQLIHGDGARGKDGFNVCAKSRSGNAVYFAGNGRVARLTGLH